MSRITSTHLLLGSLCALNWVILRESQNRFALNGCVERRSEDSHWLGALGWLSISFGTEAGFDLEAVLILLQSVRYDRKGQHQQGWPARVDWTL